MRERVDSLLKLACLAAALLLVWQIVKVVKVINPLAQVTRPEIPSYTAETNAPTEPNAGLAPDIPPQPQRMKSTHSPGTNAPVEAGVRTDTPANAATPSASANLAHTGQSSVPTLAAGTNAPDQKPPTGTNSMGTNIVKTAETNLPGAQPTPAAKATPASPGSLTAMHGPMRFPGRTSRPKAPELPPEIKARVFAIYDSELFGPVMHPMPMGLLGIAGDTAFLRAPNGQSGPVKEGGTLGEIKLLKIGTNRVLVEESGKEQELMIFSGVGGESLLKKEDKHHE